MLFMVVAGKIKDNDTIIKGSLLSKYFMLNCFFDNVKFTYSILQLNVFGNNVDK